MDEYDPNFRGIGNAGDEAGNANPPNPPAENAAPPPPPPSVGNATPPANPVNPANPTNPPERQSTNYRASKFGVVALGIYLFVLIALSIVALTVLMTADTAAFKADGTLKEYCCGGKFSNVNCNVNGSSNSAVAANNGGVVNQNINSEANSSANSNVNATTDSNVNANANANTNANVNANTNTNTNTAAKTNTTAKTDTNTKTNKNAADENGAATNSNKAGNSNGATTPFKQSIPEVTIPPEVCTQIFGGLTADSYVLWVILFAGMIGAVLRGVYSFVTHLGLGDFSFKWTWFYLLLPFSGAALSLIIYLVIRGGFYGSTLGKGLVLNLFSFAALAALTGLFSDNAIEKLRQTAEVLLAKLPPKVPNSKDFLDVDNKK